MPFKSYRKTRSGETAPLTAGRKVLCVVGMIVSPAAAFFAVQFFYHNPLTVMSVPIILWNILFYEMFYLFFFFLTRREKAALLIGDVFFLIVGLANYFVVLFRSSPILPWDLISIGTALSVAGDYQYTLSAQACACLAVFAGLFVLRHFCTYRMKKRRPVLRISGCAAVACGIVLYTNCLFSDSFVNALNLYPYLFTPLYMSERNGLTTTFLMDLQYLHIDKPDGYSASAEEQKLDSYSEDLSSAGNASGSEDDSLPNIIVIMNESFSDPAVLGDFDTNIDYMPYIHSLEQGAENTMTGYLNVSVKGGNTPNTEFEFLTGNTMRFLPNGSIPFQQYISSPKASVVSWLEELGYDTAAMHPFRASGWNRSKVYPLLGFNNLYFQQDFTSATYVRKYISDESCFEKIRQLYEEENSSSDDPLFLFTVTMQNHGGFYEDFDNFDVNVSTGLGYRPLDRYLSLLRLSDEAFQNLTEYFSTQSEKTIIVFFGDHQPNDDIVEPILNKNGLSSSTLTDEQNALRYKVPCVIWANYDISEETGFDISANYLAGKVLQAAGVPLSDYQQFLEEIRQDIPVISTQRITAADGSSMTEEDEDNSEAENEYRKMQYYRLFDDEKDAPTDIIDYEE